MSNISTGGLTVVAADKRFKDCECCAFALFARLQLNFGVRQQQRARMKVSVPVAVLIFAACGSAADGSRSPSAPRLERSPCYALELGPWSHPFPSGWAAIHIPPAIIRLDTSIVRRGWMQLTPNIPAIAAARRHREPAWRRLSEDSLHAVWSTGFSGVSLRVRQRGDSLTGQARADYDVGGPEVPVARLTGRRTACPQFAPLP